MRLFLDTNIIIDVLSKREGYTDSLTVLKCCETGVVEGWVSAATITDVMYILRKHINPQQIRDAVRRLLLIVDVCSVLKSDINAAFLSDIADVEDAVQASCAARIKADYIVTRNIKDFISSPIKAVLPSSIFNLVNPT